MTYAFWWLANLLFRRTPPPQPRLRWVYNNPTDTNVFTEIVWYRPPAKPKRRAAKRRPKKRGKR